MCTTTESRPKRCTGDCASCGLAIAAAMPAPAPSLLAALGGLSSECYTWTWHDGELVIEPR